MKLYKRIEISICIAMIISIMFSLISFAKTSESIRNDVLRLHILANSDSKEDQDLKIKVRDALLLCGENIFNGTVDIDNAVDRITPQIPYLKMIAEKVIADNGFEYNVEITLNKDFFTTRTYKDITLPSGIYLALRVIIGKGEGHNWWCVMFPAMCVPSAETDKRIENVFNEKEKNLVKKNPKYDPRFKIVEIYERIVNKT